MGERLDRADWLDHGLRVLAREGAGALKAERLARSLGVSRGSFYWHFANLDAYHVALLERWRDGATREVVAGVERSSTPPDRLETLMRRAFGADPALERAVRAWATHRPAVARMVQRVDAERVSHLAAMLGQGGVEPAEAARRARFLNWAFLGWVVTGSPEVGTIDDADVTAWAAMLLGRPP